MRIALAALAVLVATSTAPSLCTADANNSASQPTQNTQHDQRQSGERMTPLQGIEPQGPQDQSARATDSKEDKISKYAGWLMVAATIVLAIGSIWLAVIARGTAHKQLRAYVVVKAATVDLVRDKTNRITSLTCRVAFLNAGQTPAYDLEHFWSPRLTPCAIDPPPFAEANSSHRTMAILGLGVEHPEDLGTGIPLDAAQVAALQRGVLAVHISGEVRYRDTFNKKRRTRLAHQWPRIVSKIEDPRAAACRDGNGGT